MYTITAELEIDVADTMVDEACSKIREALEELRHAYVVGTIGDGGSVEVKAARRVF